MEVNDARFAMDLAAVKRRLWKLPFLLVTLTVGFAAFRIREGGTDDFVPMLIVAIFVAGVGAAVSLKQLKVARETSLVLTDKALTRQCGSSSERVAWESITHATFITDRRGLPIQVSLRAAGRPIGLFGFENMQTLGETVQKNLPSSTTVRTLTLVDVWVSTLGLFGGAIFLLIGLKLFGWNGLIQRFDLLIPIGGGLFLILGRPLSQADPRRRTNELRAGVMLIVLAIAQAIVRSA